MSNSNKLDSHSNEQISYSKRFFPPPVGKGVLVWLLSLTCGVLAIKDPSIRPQFVHLTTQAVIAYIYKRD